MIDQNDEYDDDDQENRLSNFYSLNYHNQTTIYENNINIRLGTAADQRRRRLENVEQGDHDHTQRNMTRKQYLAEQERKVKLLRQHGFNDLVGHSNEAALLRNYQLRKKKMKKRSLLFPNRYRRHHHHHDYDEGISSPWWSSLWRTITRKGNRNDYHNDDIHNQDHMMDILFPGMKPELYTYNDPIYMITDQCRSSKTHVPYDFYDTVPTCAIPSNLKYFKRIKNRHSRQNLGSKLQGSILQPTPYNLKVGVNQSCAVMCDTIYEYYHIKFLKKLIHRLYRIHISLDQLPILMRNSKHNYAIRGYPIGFEAPPSHTGLSTNEFYLYNHLKFIITYKKHKRHSHSQHHHDAQLQQQQHRKLQEEEEIEVEAEEDNEEETEENNHNHDEEDQEVVNEDVGNESRNENIEGNADSTSDGIYITGFDVLPISFDHQKAGIVCTGDATSNGDVSFINDPKTYKALRPDITNDNNSNNNNNQKKGINTSMNVQYTYEVQWIESDLPWEDRWDVYLLGSPDDDIHFFAILNSIMIVMFLTGAIAIIMIRTLRKDIMTYNEMVASTTKTTTMSSSNNSAAAGTASDPNNALTEMMMMEETGWKLVHGDVFRPPNTDYPMILSCCIGSGIQIVSTAILTLFISLFKNIINPMKKGQTLTAIVSLFVLSGFCNGYISSRLYKFFIMSSSTARFSNNLNQYNNNRNHFSWKTNTIFSATALPGIFVGIYTILNIFLHIEGATTAISFVTLLTIFALWVCVSAPLVFIGSYIGYRSDVITVPTKTNLMERTVPSYDTFPWYIRPPISYLLGGILPFGSIFIELYFIMSALWLHQIYYVMGFLFVVLLVLIATCAQVSIVMDYAQLCYEDYNWWWKSFYHCASSGLYVFLYSMWFLVHHLQLVGILSIAIYIAYMAMISLCFSLFCGSIGFLCTFWFNRTIYGALHKVD